MKLTTLFTASLMLSAAVCIAAEDETTKLNSWLDLRYEEELQRSPMDLTYYGRRDKYDQIDDVSLQAEKEWLEWMALSASGLADTFEYSKLSNQGKTSYDFWIFRAADEESARPFLEHDYVFTQDNNRHTSPVEFLANYHKVDTEADMLAYISRLGGLSHWLDQLLGRAQSAAANGIRPPRFSYEAVIRQSGLVVTGYPFPESETDAAIWIDASTKVAGLLELGKVSKDRATGLNSLVRSALLDELYPAYQRLIRWFEKDITNTNELAQGVHALPQGEAYYQRQLRHYTHSDMTAEQVHQLGLAEVARIKGDMARVQEQVGFEGSLQQFLMYVRDDPRFYYPNTDEGRKAYITEVERLLDDMSARLPDYFGLLPRATLEVKRVESYRERDGAAQFYQGGTADGSRPGVYYIHLSDMGGLNRTDLETTAYHEGNPGHHMQGSIASELSGIPEFRKEVGYSAYWEGWALYAEYLASEMGAFEDPYNDFGRLGGEMWRAIRLVVDTGLHAKGWSEEQAVQYMLENSSIPEVTVRSEIQRYLVAPGQATSYKTGMLKILALREDAKQRLGAQFDIRAFHDVVLGGGSLPLPILEQVVHDWVELLQQQ